jgi:hypothetical protein
MIDRSEPAKNVLVVTTWDKVRNVLQRITIEKLNIPS